MFNVWMGIYILFAIVTGIWGITYFMRTGRTLSAVLYFIGILAVLIIFGQRWFSNEKSVFSTKTYKWPPYVNTCPDYLTYYQRTTSTGKKDTCIDRIGVSTKVGTLNKFPATGPAPTENSYYFDLTTTSTDPKQRLAELCRKTIDAGLTWEGVTDGDSCFTPGTGTASTVAPGSTGSSSQC